VRVSESISGGLSEGEKGEGRGEKGEGRGEKGGDKERRRRSV